MRDWTEWHRGYDDPHSDLSQRLAVIQGLIRDALDAAAPGPLRLVSACAGLGLDVVGAVGSHPRRDDVSGVLVEWDAALSASSRQLLDSAGLAAIRTVVGDAGTAAVYADGAPADLVLWCGVFGNISESDVRNTLAHTPMLCAPEATVIWTRKRPSPDPTPAIRQWWTEAGFVERAFVSPGPGQFAVGSCQLASSPTPFDPSARFFTFED